MISEPLIYGVINLKLDTELMTLQSYKATNAKYKRNAEEETFSIPS